MGSRRPVVFWDFDGTLAVRDGTWPAILRDAIHTADPRSTISAADLAPWLEHGFPHWRPGQLRVYPDAAAWWAAAATTLIDAAGAAGVVPAVAVGAAADIPRIYYDPGNWRILADAVKALSQTCEAGMVNVILSNHAPELPQLVDALGFSPFVERTITSASLGAEKPDPVVYRAAMSLSAANPDSWMVGDNQIADVEGARAVGLRAVLVHRSAGDGPALSLMDAVSVIIHNS